MRGSNGIFSVLLITDRRAVPDGTDLLSQVERALDGDPEGLAILLRDKDLPFSDRASLGEPIRRAAADAGVPFLVHGDVALTRALAADGLHVQDSAAARSLLQNADTSWILGASCHSPTGIADAANAGAHYATLSPICPSPGKAAPGSQLGFGALAGPWPLPILALGGITPGHAAQAQASGAHGIAAIRAFLGAEDPASAVRSCLEALRW